jgi:hypothetical protein
MKLMAKADPIILIFQKEAKIEKKIQHSLCRKLLSFSWM